MKSVERTSAGRTNLEIIIGLLGEVVVRVVNSAQGKDMDVSVITPNREWSLSTSSTGAALRIERGGPVRVAPPR